MIDSPKFSIRMALTHMYKCSSRARRKRLFRKLFDYDPAEVDFYLPQLVCILLYIECTSLKVLQFYFEFRCRKCNYFAKKFEWCINTLRSPNAPLSKRIVEMFCHLEGSPILSSRFGSTEFKASGKSRAIIVRSDQKSRLPKVTSQDDFVQHIAEIEEGLENVPNRHDRARQLMFKLNEINLCTGNAKLWNPLVPFPHEILHIPVNECAILNSKCGGPFVFYMESLEKPKETRRKRSSSEGDASSLNSGSYFESLKRWSVEDYVYIPNWEIRTSEMDEYDIVSSRDVLLSRIYSSGDDDHLMPDNEQDDNPLSLDISTDYSVRVLSENWGDKVKRVRCSSKFGHISGWSFSGCIVKCGKDLRSELLASQFLQLLEEIWKLEHIPVYVRPVRTVLVNRHCALIEPLPNTESLHQVRCRYKGTLKEYFNSRYGDPVSAQHNFVASAAGYSVACYLLQVKDRHNGNLLLDSEGHIIHIDFGFILDARPGNIGFERAEFKITPEFVEVMGGKDSNMFQYYKLLIFRALSAARKHRESLILLVDIMRQSEDLKCCKSSTVISDLESRFQPCSTDDALTQFVEGIVEKGLSSRTTWVYDYYQYKCSGIH